jgi:hypothetical protein
MRLELQKTAKVPIEAARRPKTRRNVTQVIRTAIEIPAEEKRRSDKGVEPNALAQIHPKTKYKGGVPLILSWNASSIWMKELSDSR